MDSALVPATEIPMPDEKLFQTDITPEEYEAGFRLMHIANPQPSSNRPKSIEAVVYPVGDSHRLVKLCINGVIEYNLQLFCAVRFLPPHIEPDWKPLDYFFSRHDSMTATKAVRQWIMENPPPQQWETRIPAEGQ